MIAKKKKCEVLVLQGSNIPILNSKKKFGHASPTEFVELIKNAQHVITDSFHGLALSINFKKDFNVFLPKKRSERLVNLLKITNLQNRIIEEGAPFNYEHINYLDVDKMLVPFVESSRDFLFSALEALNE